MAIFTTEESVNLPRQIADGMVAKAQTGSVVAALSAAEPMRFGNVDIITFNERPRAEFVEPGAEKAPTSGPFGVVTAAPKKAQVTMRFDQEVQWADEDHQLGVITTLADAGAVATARALDLGLIHRINPLTGAEIGTWTNYLAATEKRVEITEGAPVDQLIEAAAGLVIGDQEAVSGVALDPSFGWKLATARYPDGRKMYPELGYGTDISRVNGLAASVSNTVSGQPEAADSGIRGIVGDFAGGIRWGVQRNLPLEIIRTGDPDGQGDLKRRNQIALRLEIVYGWYVFADRFAIIENPA